MQCNLREPCTQKVAQCSARARLSCHQVLDMLLLFIIGGGLSLLADLLAFPPDIHHLDGEDGL